MTGKRTNLTRNEMGSSLALNVHKALERVVLTEGKTGTP
jgi:hypothetical protein